MKTAMTVLNGHEELSELDRMILAETENDEHAYDFIATKIRLPSGGVNAFTTTDGEVLSPPLIGIAAVSQKARAYWPTVGTGSAPLCSSADGVTGWLHPEPEAEQMKAADAAPFTHPGIVDDAEPSPYRCAACPLSQWGSASDGGRGQACKTLRRLVLLLDGFRMPALLTLPPTSVRAWDAYCSGLASRNSAYFAVQTRFELEKVRNGAGVDYAVVKLSAAGSIEDRDKLEAVISLRRQYADLVRQMEIETGEYYAETA